MKQKEIFTFRMAAGIKFNREIDPIKDHISPGGYEFVMGGKNVQFDFENHAGCVNEDDKRILDIYVKNPMYSEYPELENVTKEMLKDISEIKEFFVYTGEPGESDLKPVALKYVWFELMDDNYTKINVKKAILDKVVF